MVGSVVLARAVGDKRLKPLLQAGRHALRDQAAGNNAGACPGDKTEFDRSRIGE
jgi:hypothetical protein